MAGARRHRYIAAMDLVRRFVTGMGFVALAVLDFERHRLNGLGVWHYARLTDGSVAPGRRMAWRGSMLLAPPGWTGKRGGRRAFQRDSAARDAREGGEQDSPA